MGEHEGRDVERSQRDGGRRTAAAQPEDARGQTGGGEDRATEGPDAGALRDAEAGSPADGPEGGGGGTGAGQGGGRQASQSPPPRPAAEKGTLGAPATP